MSFSSKVKQEILSLTGPRHCRIAELSAIVDCYDKALPDFEAKTGNSLVQTKFNMLTKADFNPSSSDGWAAKMLCACDKKTNPVKSECCKRAYVRGMYLAAGTMANPANTYHMEFAINSDQLPYIIEIFAFFDLNPKMHSRKSQQILYFKEAEQIATILNIIGAHIALMEFENCRVGKDVNNAINRVANAAAANADKVVAASAKHVSDIMLIQSMAGLSVLNEGLAQVAVIRQDNPLLSLEDMGKMLIPPISKSGVNHRLKKIALIADGYRQKTQKVSTELEVTQ